jgi:hypothetical protein
MSVALPALRTVLALVKRAPAMRACRSLTRGSFFRVQPRRIYRHLLESLGVNTISAVSIPSIVTDNVDVVLGSSDEPETLFEAFVEDAMHFTRFFAKPMQHSASHVYFSALPLSPTQPFFFLEALPPKIPSHRQVARRARHLAINKTLFSYRIPGVFSCIFA